MKTNLLAKIARPKLSSIVERDRLFRLLDWGKQQKPVIWVAAQGGSGKTTLVSSWLDARKLSCLWYQVDEGDADIASFFYFMRLAAKIAAPRYKKSLPLLTPEYFQGIPVFTRRYFEELFRRLCSISSPKGGDGFVVVLDNYQDAPLASGFHDMIACGLDTIPDGITVVIQSRTAPPPQLARLQANGRLHTIGMDDVRFSREESHDLLEMQGHSRLAPETLELLQNITEGWAAGLILLAEAGATSSSPSNMKADALLDYFASEIFNKADAPIQDVLLKTSFLQKIDPAMAAQLTGNATAGTLLESMSRSNYFTQKYGQVYQYHPLFREFLQKRANATLAPADIVATQRTAARLLEQYGREEEAIGLHIAALDWSNAERAILDQAQRLMLQGRSNTLEAWLNCFPHDCIETSPWALYWLGICRLAYNPVEARDYFEKAFLQFKKDADVSGLFLSWACIVDTFVYEWGDFKPLDHWIEVANNLIADHPEFPTPEIEARVAAGMLNAMTYRQPYRAELPMWAELVGQVVVKHPSIQMRMMLGNYLIIYYLWVGDFAKAGLVIEVLRPVSCKYENDPLTRQHWYIMEAMYSFFVADNKTCMQLIGRGLKNAEESGIHLLDLYLLGQGVYSNLSLGEPSEARSFLGRMASINSPRLLDKSFYQYQASSVAWYYGDLKKAIEHGKLAVAIAEDVSTPFAAALCLAELSSILFDDGQYEEALKYLTRAAESGRGMNFIAYMCALNGARFNFDRGNDQQGLVLLNQGLALGSQQGYVNMPRWNSRTMSRLCAKALAHDIETGYVRRLIVMRGLTPEQPVENWPYPIRIYTLGRFNVELDGKPLVFEGRVQRKPLELLQAIIALGGADVPALSVIDELWPQAKGGTAGDDALATALRRLRTMLGSTESVLLQNNRMTLNPALVWTDAQAFEALADAPEDPQQAGRMLALYHGPFLGNEPDDHFLWPMRERLRGKLLRAIMSTGRMLQEQGRHTETIALFERGINSEPLAEEFYAFLMCIHEALGRYNEAISVYRRCEKTLGAILGMRPSPETETIHKRLRIQAK